MWPGPALLLLGLGLGLGSQPPSLGPRGLLRCAPGLGQDEESSVGGDGTGGPSPRTAPRRALPTLPRRCPSGTATRVLLKVNSSDPADTTATASCQTATCTMKPVKINRNHQNAPLTLSRKEEVTLKVTMSWDCPGAMDVSKRWLYFSVASVNDTPDWNRPVLLPQVRETNFSSIHIPKSALPYGVYVFNFTLSIIRCDPTLPPLTSSDSIYIWVKKRSLEAILSGAANMTVNFSDELILNGSMSHDPEADIPTEGLQFFWYCTTNPRHYGGNFTLVTNQDVCHPEQDALDWPWAMGSVLTILPETLRGDDVYYFRMVVRKQNRIAYADKTVRVLKGPQPKAIILCIENCEPTLVVSDRFSLFLDCTGCASQDFYSWSILSQSGHEVMFDWAGQAVTRRNGAYLSIKAFAFRNFLESGFWVSLHLISWSGVTMTLRHPFVINHGPQIGKCTINPAKGISMVTKFVVECSDFKDKNLPLKYKIIVADLDSTGEISSVEENTLGTIAYLGTQSTTPAFFLPVGMVANRYNVRLYAQVYDSLGSFSQVTLQATVQMPTVRDSSKDVLQQLLSFTMDPGSPLSASLQKQDWLPMGYSLYVVASVLNSIERELKFQRDRTHLLERLLGQSFVPSMSTLDEICQVVMVITKLTQNVSDFGQVVLTDATLRLWQANQAPENISADVVGFRMTGATDNDGTIEITPDVAEVYLVRKDLTISSFSLMVGPGMESAGFSKMTTGGISFEVDSRGIGEVMVHVVTDVTVLFKALVYAGSQITPTNLVAIFLVPHDIPPIATWRGPFDPTCPVKEARVVCLPSSMLRIIAQHSRSFRYNISVILQAPRFVFKPTNKLKEAQVNLDEVAPQEHPLMSEESLFFRSRDRDQSDFFIDMLYGQPEKNNRRLLGLKTRNINGKKRIYLVV